MSCHIAKFGSSAAYKYVVVLSHIGDQLLLSRHKQRDTWETQGGHVEKGETPEQAARRELYEESGGRARRLIPLCDYNAADAQGQASGAVFVAEIEVLEPMPDSEMAQTRLFDALPPDDQLTYPQITPLLYRYAKASGLL